MSNNKTEIPNQKRIRAFAPFLNKEHQDIMFNELLDVIPKKHAHRLWLYMGMLDSTIAEGYKNDNS
jgi:tRNA(Phe) wybutosine-synthesizing methylase Tyw3